MAPNGDKFSFMRNRNSPLAIGTGSVSLDDTAPPKKEQNQFIVVALQHCIPSFVPELIFGVLMWNSWGGYRHVAASITADRQLTWTSMWKMLNGSWLFRDSMRYEETIQA